MQNGETTIYDLMEFLQENMVTKGEFSEALKEMVTKKEMKAMETRFDERFSRIDERFNRVDAELTIIEQDLADIKERLQTLEQRTKEDADASLHEVLALKKRVDMLEQKVLQLQTAHGG